MTAHNLVGSSQKKEQKLTADTVINKITNAT